MLSKNKGDQVTVDPNHMPFKGINVSTGKEIDVHINVNAMGTIVSLLGNVASVEFVLAVGGPVRCNINTRFLKLHI